MTTTHVVISNDAHPECTTFNIETATSAVQPCTLLYILHDNASIMQLTLEAVPTITRVRALGVDTESERKVPQERLDRALARCRDWNESATHTQEVCLRLLKELREIAAEQTAPKEILGLVSVEQLPTKSSSYSLLAVVGANTSALPLAAVAHVVFQMGMTVLYLNLDTGNGMAVTILAVQLKGQALPASVMKEALKQLREDVVVPVTVDHVESSQRTFEAPSLTTPAAVDRWTKERNAWVHSLAYSAKSAADQVEAGKLTLAAVRGFECVSEQQDQTTGGLDIQGNEAKKHGAVAMLRKSPIRRRRSSTGKDGKIELEASAEPKPASSLAGGGAAAGLIHQGVRKNIQPPKSHLDVGGSLHGTNHAMRVLSMNSHCPEEPILPSKSALSMLSKPVKSSVDEKKSYMSLAKQMFLGSAAKKETDHLSLSAKGSTSVHGMNNSQIQRSSTMVPHKSEVENAKTKKPPTTPLRHTESFSKRQVNAWYSMPWVTQADPTTKEGCWEAPGPSEFEVIYRIGEGLTSCVYLARIKRANEFSSGLDSKCVLKVMRKDQKLLDGQLVGDVAVREIGILSDLQSSPFVIRMFGTFSTDQYLFLVTEWAPCDMFQLMTDNFGSYRFWCNVRIYAGQVLLALEHLHQAGYIYCDLKPENLLVCHDGSVKVSDMGLAVRFPEPGKLLYRMCGTSEYMSPEMVCRKGYSYMTDIWSFGVFVYELLTCSTPFQAAEGEQQGNAHVVERLRHHTKITFPPDVSVEASAKDLTLGLLTRAEDKRLGAKDPPGQYQSVKSHPWFADMNWKALARGLHTPSILPLAAPESMIRCEGKLSWMENAE